MCSLCYIIIVFYFYLFKFSDCNKSKRIYLISIIMCNDLNGLFNSHSRAYSSAYIHGLELTRKNQNRIMILNKLNLSSFYYYYY